jgi:predicted transposase/invertase (TIGR01784 family)
MYYLKHSAVKSDFDAPGLSAANELLEYSRLSREDKLRYDWYVDKWRSNVSSINTARDEGKAEGLAEGEARSRADIARKLKASGVPLDVIAQTTGLSSEEIEGLLVLPH